MLNVRFVFCVVLSGMPAVGRLAIYVDPWEGRAFWMRRLVMGSEDGAGVRKHCGLDPQDTKDGFLSLTSPLAEGRDSLPATCTVPIFPLASQLWNRAPVLTNTTSP